MFHRWSRHRKVLRCWVENSHVRTVAQEREGTESPSVRSERGSTVVVSRFGATLEHEMRGETICLTLLLADDPFLSTYHIRQAGVDPVWVGRLG